METSKSKAQASVAHTPHRRAFLTGATVSAIAVSAAASSHAQDQIGTLGQGTQAQPLSSGQWVSTTKDKPWQTIPSGLKIIELKSISDFNVMIQPEVTFQTIDGFGSCLHEKGWQGLSALKPADRDGLLHELFAPGVGANFNICRIPIGANDYALDWYSHNETDGDFAMSKFSIDRDKAMLIPFIKAAQNHQKDLSLWASPWSPPTWMKRNKYYALAKPIMGLPDNGIRDDQLGSEGTDTFIQDDRYFKAYALYFSRFVQAYRQLGLPINMVMPQNEFNSAQVFPSCTWTPEGLARFIPFLGEEMQKLGVDVFLGTLERAKPELFEAVYADPRARPYIKGVGAQWAGRQAVPFIHKAHPELKIYQSEQECGNGFNDWRFARFSWAMMKDFMRAGANVYQYWNTATPVGGVSSWGWKQNSLISVDLKAQTYTLNPDYYIFKHMSHFVKPGAQRINTLSFAGFENMLAFKNPDGKLVIIAQNDLSDAMPLNMTIGSKTYQALLPADSFNTFVI